MHPALSVIIFTTASGAGYGLLILLVLFGLGGVLPGASVAAFGFCALALALIAGGLLSSTRHLGRPERAWGALRQWRRSWLAREGVAALAAFVPAAMFALAWGMFGLTGGVAAWTGAVAAALAFVTVLCTGMIYASVRAVAAWNSGLVPPTYLVLGVMTGALLLNLLTRLSGQWSPSFAVVVVVSLLLGWWLKVRGWRRLDIALSPSTIESATGLGRWGRVRLLDAAHTEPTFIQHEMGGGLALDAAARLRRLVHLSLFLLPLLLTGAAALVGASAATMLSALAVASAAVGVGVERWLFFAEARHAVTLYYRRS